MVVMADRSLWERGSLSLPLGLIWTGTTKSGRRGRPSRRFCRDRENCEIQGKVRPREVIALASEGADPGCHNNSKPAVFKLPFCVGRHKSHASAGVISLGIGG